MYILMCRSLLQERSQEVLLYLRFLKTVIYENAELHLPKRKENISINKDLTHTLKANGYLLFYNVVEATMSTAIDDIHRAIRADLENGRSNLTLDCLNPGLFKRVLSRFRSGKEDMLSQAAPSAGTWLVEYWLNDHDKEVNKERNPLISGNLDGRKMLEMAKMYGFDVYGRAERLKHPGLFKAKEKRNDLAHGKTSFKDCGTDTAIDDLVREGVGVLRCLRHHVCAVEAFIAQRGYVRHPPAAAALALQPA